VTRLNKCVNKYTLRHDHLLIDDTNSGPQLHEPITIEGLHQYVSQLVVGTNDFNLYPTLINAVLNVVIVCVNVLTMIMQDRVST
jgi:hypothetical protein